MTGMDSILEEALLSIYAAAAEPDRWREALQGVADCLGDVGAVMIWQRNASAFAAICSPGLDAAQRDYESHWYRHDLPARRAIERSLWLRYEAITDRHAVSDEEIQTHPFYTEFRAKHGLRWCASVGIAPATGLSVAISSQRSLLENPHAEQQLALLRQLGKHAERGLRLSVRLMDCEAIRTSLQRALNQIGLGVFVLDARNRIAFVNETGTAISGGELSISRGEFRVRGRALGEMLGADFASIHKPLDDLKPILLEGASVGALPSTCCRSCPASQLSCQRMRM